MRRVRHASVLLASVLVVAAVSTQPARAGAGPTTLAIEGTVRVVVVEPSGPAAAEHFYSIETDDGVMVPVALDDAPANGRFAGELVVRGEVAEALDDRDLLPRAGSTIDEDTRAGRVAVTAAQDEQRPLAVATSTITAAAVSAASLLPSPHRAYVAVMTNRGTGTPPTVTAAAQTVASMGAYWTAESDGIVSALTIVGVPVPYESAIAATDNASCGTGSNADLNAMWAEARSKFPGVTWRAQGDHLIVLVNRSCTVGIGSVGSSLASGGYVTMVLGNGDDQIGVHELGHNFGLDHANLQRCPTSTSCTSQEYYDVYSPMGLAVTAGSPEYQPPALDSAFRSRLGLADTGEIPLVTPANGPATRSVRLQPRSAGAGTRGLEVVDPVSGVHYFLDHRSGTGRDGTSFYASRDVLGGLDVDYDPGVTVSTPAPGGAITLLTRDKGTRYDGSYGPGQTFTSPSGSIQVAVGARVGDAIDVTVTFDGSTDATPTTPTATPVVPEQAVAPKRLGSAAPRIVGAPRVGRTLKVKVGSWSPRPSFRYQWYAGGRKIAKATRSSVRLTTRQKGKRITVVVTGSRPGYTTAAKTSRATAKVRKK